jgi:hypothetical protein
MKIISVFVIICFILIMTGCGQDKTIDGKHYKTYGLLTLDQKDPNIKYEIIMGNVIWSVILIETLVFPVYFIGFSLYEPVGR